MDFSQRGNCYEEQERYDGEEDYQFDEGKTPPEFLNPLHDRIRLHPDGTSKVNFG